MHLLIKNTTITHPASQRNGQTNDILVVNGKIEAIDSPGAIDAGKAEIFDGTGTRTSPGWMDMRARFADPGDEHKEDIESGSRAAAAGGFTGVAVLPTTQPPIHSKSEVEYILNKGRGRVTSVYPMGCITHHREGKELAEMYDMYTAGAIAFTDGNKPVKDSGLMHRALLYAKGFNGLLCIHAEDTGMSAGGQMNEGPTAVHLGMKGIPNLAEELAMKRDIDLARYNNARLHFSHISTAEGVQLVRQAKAEGLLVTADVALPNLVWDDSVLEEYDTNFKLVPPLRARRDVDALLQGLKDGTIDAICTDHTPQDPECKVLEYEYASPGMIGLQTFLPLLLQIEPVLGWDRLIDAISTRPRQILGLPQATLETGAAANFTVYNTNQKWMYNRSTNLSKSHNSPLLGTELTGKVMMIINNHLKQQF